MEKFLGSGQLITIMTVVNIVIALITWSLYRKSVVALKNNDKNEEILEKTIEEISEDKNVENKEKIVETCLEDITDEDQPEEVPEEVVAAIAAALVAMGYPMAQIASIRPRKQQQWKLDGRMHNMV